MAEVPLGAISAAGVGATTASAEYINDLGDILCQGVAAVAVTLNAEFAPDVTATGTSTASAHLHEASAHATSLLIGSETVQLREGGHAVRFVPLAPTGRAYVGELRRAIRSGIPARGYVHEWTLDFVAMPISDVAALETALSATGPITVSGSVLGVDYSASCYVRDIQRMTGRSLEWAEVSCTLLEAEPFTN